MSGVDSADRPDGCAPGVNRRPSPSDFAASFSRADRDNDPRLHAIGRLVSSLIPCRLRRWPGPLIVALRACLTALDEAAR